MKHKTDSVPMPSPFVRGVETEAVRRAELLRASPEVARVRAETEAALAEAERIATEARAKLQEREEAVELLRSIMIEERGLAGNVAFFRQRQKDIAAELSGAEAQLDSIAVRFNELDGAAQWRRFVEHSVNLNAEAVHVDRVLPKVTAALADVQARRAELQRTLGFAVTGLAGDGSLEGSEPEAESPRHEWRGDGSRDTQRLQPVEA